MEEKESNTNNEKIKEQLLKIGSDEIYLEEIFCEYKWDEIFSVFVDIISIGTNDTLPLIENMFKETYWYFGLEAFLELLELIIKTNPDKKYIPLLDEKISNFYSDTDFFEYDATEVLKIMFKIGGEELIPYLANYASNFIYADGNHMCGDGNEKFRFEATKLLGKFKSPKTLDALINVLNKEGISERIIISAVKGLGDCGSKEAIPYLYRMSLGYWFYNDRVSNEYADPCWGFRYNEELKKEAQKALKKLGVSEVDEIKASLQFLNHYGKITEDYEFLMESIIKIMGINSGIVIFELLKEKQEEPFLNNIIDYIWDTKSDVKMVSEICRNIIDFQRTYIETKERAIEYMPIADSKQEIISYLLSLAQRNKSLIPEIANKLVNELNAYKEATPLILKAMNSIELKDKRENILYLMRNPEIDLNIKLPELIRKYYDTRNYNEKSNILITILELMNNENSFLLKNQELFQNIKPIIIENLTIKDVKLREKTVQTLFKYYNFSIEISEALKNRYFAEEDFRVSKLYIQLFEQKLVDDFVPLLQKKIRENENIITCKEEIIFLYNLNVKDSKQDLLKLLKSPDNKFYSDIFNGLHLSKLSNIIPELLEIIAYEKENFSLVFSIISNIIKKHKIQEAIPILREILITPPTNKIKQIVSLTLFEIYLGRKFNNFQKMTSDETLSIVEGLSRETTSNNELIPTIPYLTDILQSSNDANERIRSMDCIFMINSNISEYGINLRKLRKHLKKAKKILIKILTEDKVTSVRKKAAFTIKLFNKQKTKLFLSKQLYIPDIILVLLQAMKTEVDEISCSCIQTLDYLHENLEVIYVRNENLYFKMTRNLIKLNNYIENELLTFYFKIRNDKEFKCSTKALRDIKWFKKKLK